MKYITFDMPVDPALYGFAFNGELQEVAVTYSIMCPGSKPKVYVQGITAWPPLLREINNMHELIRQAQAAAENNAMSVMETISN